ncbi:hypothetical protein DPM13_07925 [Paracoccus mutanolyticus]|uniref:Uncharacterized protein n=1 Tax=Paracoccus mutanolyticus TaxID=1499308 RepID=A0ABN5M5C0_9RHOB|nr:hypothetical protein DPM13_07925 [Paracoccus mutanolyticus]
MMRHELRRPVISALMFVAATLLILAFGMAALGALLAPQVGWAGLWGAVTDFAAPRPPRCVPRAGRRFPRGWDDGDTREVQPGRP